MNFRTLLLLPILLLSTFAALPITITTNDGKSFELTKKEAECSNVIKNILEDMEGMEADTPIQLPNVTSQCFQLFQEYINLCIENAKAPTMVSIKLRENVSLEDRIELLKAASYLDCEILREITTEAIASDILQNTPDVPTARRLLSCAADFTAELSQHLAHAIFIEDFEFTFKLYKSYQVAHPEVTSRMALIKKIKHNMLFPQALALVLAFNADGNGTPLFLDPVKDTVFIDALAELDIPFLQSLVIIEIPTKDYTLIAAGTAALAIAAWNIFRK